MAKVDKELKSKREDAIKDLENIKCEHPGVSEKRLKDINEYVEKLIKKNDESKD
jgi:hypothetical protein